MFWESRKLWSLIRIYFFLEKLKSLLKELKSLLKELKSREVCVTLPSCQVFEA